TTQPTSADTTKSQSLDSQFVPVNTIQPDLSQTSTLQCTSSLNVQGHSIGISGTSVGQFTQITQVVSSTPPTTAQPSIACTQPTSGSLESTQFQSFDAQYSTTLYRSGLDFSKIVPTLCQNGVLPGNLNQEPNSVHPKCVLCSFTAETEMELDDHMNAH
uniref:Uncharacterized protein n=1 Tax=Ciona savignyi TaxID=51511 RepID=H2Z1Z1_CIOSA